MKPETQVFRNMRVSSDIKEIRRVSNQIEDFLRSNGADDHTIFDIRLCVEEALRNAITHGNKGKLERFVLVGYGFVGEKFSVEIEDEGEGFDPAKVPDPRDAENLLREGGRGVFIIMKVMDEVVYSEKGNKVSMAKYIKKGKGEHHAGKAGR